MAKAPHKINDSLIINADGSIEDSNNLIVLNDDTTVSGDFIVTGSASFGSVSTTLDGLSDVTLTGPASGEFLFYDGGEWTNKVSWDADATKEPTGFENLTDSTLSFDNGTRTLSITPTGTTFNIFISGKKYSKTTQQKQIDNTEGLHYIYFDATGTLVSTTTFDIAIITNYVLASIVYWDATNNQGLFFNERHGITMDGATHAHLHRAFGAQYYSGLSLTDILSGQDGSLVTHAQFGLTEGAFADEDILHTVSAITAPANVPVLYQIGTTGTWRWTTPDDYPIIRGSTVLAGGGTTGFATCAYNQFTGGAWQLSQVGSNNFFLVHLAVGPDPANPVYAYLGQSFYATLSTAQAGANSELASFIGSSLPNPEFIFIGTLIFKTNATYAADARIEQTDTGADYVDWRTALSTPTGGYSVSDHGQLTGLGDVNDHLLYLDLAGTRSMTGSLDMAGNVIYDSVGTLILDDNTTVSGDLTITGSTTGINHTELSNIGTNTHAQIDTHISDSTIHFTEASIDHTNIQNVGTNTHSQLDDHVASGVIHFLEGDISHLNIQDIGSNSHSQIDSHISDSTLHFTDAAYLKLDGSRAMTGALDIGGNSIYDSVGTLVLNDQVTVSGEIDMVGNTITDSTGPLILGINNTPNVELGTGDVYIGNKFEIEGSVFINQDGTIDFYDAIHFIGGVSRGIRAYGNPIYFGTGSDTYCGMIWRDTTNPSMIDIKVPTQSNVLGIMKFSSIYENQLGQMNQATICMFGDNNNEYMYLTRESSYGVIGVSQDVPLHIYTDVTIGSGNGTLTCSGLIISPSTERYIDLNPILPTTNPGAFEGVGTFGVVQLAADADDFIHYNFQVPYEWDGSTDMTMEILWFGTSGDALNSESVKFDISYRTIGFASNEVYDNGTVATGTVTYSSGAPDTDKQTYLSEITLDWDETNQTLVAGQLVGIQFSRDANVASDYSGIVNIAQVRIKYNANSLTNVNL